MLKIAAIGGEVPLVDKVGGSIVMSTAIATFASSYNTCHHGSRRCGGILVKPWPHA